MKGEIYFASMASGPIKIGFTTDLPRRLSNLFYTVPGGVTLITSFFGDPQAEAWLHKKFSHLRISGEWFFPSEDLLNFIAEAKMAGNEVIPDAYRADGIEPRLKAPHDDEVKERARFYLQSLCLPIKPLDKTPDKIRRAAERGGLSERRAKGIWYGEAHTITASEFIQLREAFDAHTLAQMPQTSFSNASAKPARPTYDAVW